VKKQKTPVEIKVTEVYSLPVFSNPMINKNIAIKSVIQSGYFPI